MSIPSDDLKPGRELKMSHHECLNPACTCNPCKCEPVCNCGEHEPGDPAHAGHHK